MHITAVRHGETNENAAGIIQGQVFGTLSEKGLQQTQELGERLRMAQFDICISSDLERCKLTAAAILQYHPDTPVRYDVRFRERSMKPFEGKLFTEVDWQWERDGQLDFKAPEGETWSQVINRVGDGLNELFAAHADQQVLIVSHGGPLRAMMALLAGGEWHDIGRMPIDNCEVLQWDMTAPVDAARVH